MNYFKILIVAILTFTLSNLKAQDFEVAPVVINFDANPGEIQKSMITIRNHSNIKQTYTLTMGDFIVQPDGTKKRIAAGQSDRSCAQWLSLSPSFVELNPNEKKEITVLMTVPSDGFTTRWCYVYIQTSQEQTENPVDKQLATGIKITPRIAVLINQSPKSNKDYKGIIYDLKDVSEKSDSVYTYNVVVENTGDKVLEANVQLYLANLETAKEQKFAKKMERVYPGEKRTFTLTLPKNLEKGSYALAAILDYGHSTSLEGAQIMIDL